MLFSGELCKRREESDSRMTLFPLFLSLVWSLSNLWSLRFTYYKSQWSVTIFASFSSQLPPENFITRALGLSVVRLDHFISTNNSSASVYKGLIIGIPYFGVDTSRLSISSETGSVQSSTRNSKSLLFTMIGHFNLFDLFGYMLICGPKSFYLRGWKYVNTFTWSFCELPDGVRNLLWFNQDKSK